MKRQTQQHIGIFLIILGVLCFILIGVLSIWADLEASLFNSARRSQESLTSLKCPSIISSGESGIISASFMNPSERTIKPKIQTFVSDGYVILMQEQVNTLTIEPRETKVVEVEVSPENAVYNRIILVRMHQFAYRPLPYRNASCGIYVIDLPFLTGRQFIILSFGSGVLLSGLGILLWGLSSRPIVWDRMTKLKQLLVFILLAILISIIGLLSLWLLGLLLFVFWLLFAIGLLSQAALSAKKSSKNNNDNKP